MQKMNISVTQPHATSRDCVNRVHYQNATFILHKRGKLFAVRPPQKICLGRDLAKGAGQIETVNKLMFHTV